MCTVHILFAQTRIQYLSLSLIYNIYYIRFLCYDMFLFFLMVSTRVHLPNVLGCLQCLNVQAFQLMALVAATFRNCPKVDDDDAIPDTKAVSPEMKGHHLQMPSNFISVD